MKKTCTIDYSEIYLTKNSDHIETSQLKDIWRSVCERAIHERALRKRNLYVCSDRTRFSVSWKSLGDGVWRQEEDLFHRLFWKKLYQLWLQVQETRLRSIQKITMFRLKIMRSLSCASWMQIGRRIRLEQHYGLLYMGLKIQRQVHLRLHQGKITNSRNNTRRFRNVEQFTRSVTSVQRSMVYIYKKGNFNQRISVRIDLTWKWTLNKAIRNTIWMVEHVSITGIDYRHCIMMCSETFIWKRIKDPVILTSSVTAYLKVHLYLDI